MNEPLLDVVAVATVEAGVPQTFVLLVCAPVAGRVVRDRAERHRSTGERRAGREVIYGAGDGREGCNRRAPVGDELGAVGVAVEPPPPPPHPDKVETIMNAAKRKRCVFFIVPTPPDPRWYSRRRREPRTSPWSSRFRVQEW